MLNKTIEKTSKKKKKNPINKLEKNNKLTCYHDHYQLYELS